MTNLEAISEKLQESNNIKVLGTLIKAFTGPE